jgi:hypothetical protein
VKISIRNMFVLLAMVLALAAAQAVWAESCNVTVSGEVTAINSADNAITLEDATVVYGIPLSYLANKLKIVIKEGDYVVATAYQCPSTGQISACTLSVNGGSTITLPGLRSR